MCHFCAPTTTSKSQYGIIFVMQLGSVSSATMAHQPILSALEMRSLADAFKLIVLWAWFDQARGVEKS